MKKIRTALGAMLFVIIIGGTQACTESPTGPAQSDTECAWFDGVLHCSN